MPAACGEDSHGCVHPEDSTRCEGLRCVGTPPGGIERIEAGGGGRSSSQCRQPLCGGRHRSTRLDPGAPQQRPRSSCPQSGRLEPVLPADGADTPRRVQRLKKPAKLWLTIPAVASGLLERLAGDSYISVRSHIAKNRSTAPKFLRRLADDRSSAVRCATATNLNCPADLLERLATDRNNDVRHATAANPACPVDLLTQLATSADISARRGAATNEATPRWLRRRLSKDPDASVRLYLARNPSLSWWLLMRLAADPDDSVRARAVR